MSLILLFALLAGDVPATVSTEAKSSAPAVDASATNPAAANTEAKKEKKICKADEAFTGTRMAKRICLTRSQWEQRARSMGAGDRLGRR